MTLESCTLNRLFRVALISVLCLMAAYAVADTVGQCGPRPNPGDYIRTPAGKVWCEMPGSGAWAVLPYVLATLGSLYGFVSGLNLWVAFGIGFAAVTFGTRLVGSPASVSGTVTSWGVFNGTIRPAVEGTASTFGGRLLGIALNLLGTIVLIMAVVSCASCS
jgi:hypothetical protein